MKSKQPYPLEGKYWIQNPLGKLFLGIVDFIVQFFPNRSKHTQSFQKILICNSGHLGDVVIATCVIPAIKKKYPNSQLGFLVGSWGKPAIAQRQDLDFVHTLDHWKLNRSNRSKWSKYFQYRKTRKQCLTELRSISYDVAIDLYFFYPNAIPILWRAKIPTRIGYMSGGYGPLLTNSRNWEFKDKYVGYYHLDLLKRISIDVDLKKDSKPFIPSDFKSSTTTLKKFGIEGGYYIFHVGAGNSLKKWKIEKWIALAKLLEKREKKIVFTGYGEHEEKEVEKIRLTLENSIDVCSKLSWEEFVGVIQSCEMLISCDSVAPHISLSQRVPTVVIGNGMSLNSLWFYPEKERAFIVSQVSCSPCFLKHGCPDMSCIRNISVDHVIKTIDKMAHFSLEKKGVKKCEFV